MDRTPLSSTALVSAGYDAEARTLEVEFRSGRVYRYLDVPPGVFEFLVRTRETGRYFNRMINGIYTFEEIAVAPPEQDLVEVLRASIARRERER